VIGFFITFIYKILVLIYESMASFSERGDKIESRAKRELSLSILSPTVDLSIALSHLLGITFTIM
jgi:hypothetical protein